MPPFRAEEEPREIAPGVILVDTGYLHPGVAAAYLVRGKRSAAVVEAGTGLSTGRILEALARHDIPRSQVSHVIVTHVHLDHAGGAGALLRELPGASLVAHPRGAPHLVDPSSLVAGAAAVYGDEARLRALYGEIVPAPRERVVEAPDGFTVDLGERPLRMLDAPGHARHHFVVQDAVTRGFFTGDTFGISYRETDGGNGPFLFPTTTPIQFDPAAFHASIDRMLVERPERMYLTHFGMLEGQVERCAAELHRAIDEHVRVAEAAPAGEGRYPAIRRGLEAQLLRSLERHGFPGTREEALAIFSGDLDLNAQGLEFWLAMRGGRRP